MKTILFALISTVSLVAFAGPEDHFDKQICYNLEAGSQRLVPDTPEQICVETVTVDLENNQIEVYNYFHRALFQDVNLTYLARHNENGFSFRSEKVLQKQETKGCDSGFESVLKINGRADNYGAAEAEYLDITVEQFYTPDNCHSRGTKSVLKYVR